MDAIETSPLLSVGILTVPGREPLLEALVRQIGAIDFVRFQVQVYVDSEWRGVLWNSRRAWCERPAGVSHRLVLESDIAVCQDLLPAVAQLVTLRPDAYINLYGNSYRALPYYRQGVRWRPYVFPSAQGACLPDGWIDPFWAWVDELPATAAAKQAAALQKRPSDYAADVLLFHWLREMGRPAYVTVPGLVWHLGWSDSQAFDRPQASGGWLEPKPYTFLGEEQSALAFDWRDGLMINPKDGIWIHKETARAALEVATALHTILAVHRVAVPDVRAQIERVWRDLGWLAQDAPSFTGDDDA